VKRRPSKARPPAKGPSKAARKSTAAATSDAVERERIQGMSALERALLALDLGERFSTFAKPRR
jgi:hypothetical protein